MQFGHKALRTARSEMASATKGRATNPSSQGNGNLSKLMDVHFENSGLQDPPDKHGKHPASAVFVNLSPSIVVQTLLPKNEQAVKNVNKGERSSGELGAALLLLLPPEQWYAW